MFVLQVPENPHSEYGLTENVEVRQTLLLSSVAGVTVLRLNVGSELNSQCSQESELGSAPADCLTLSAVSALSCVASVGQNAAEVSNERFDEIPLRFLVMAVCASNRPCC